MWHPLFTWTSGDAVPPPVSGGYHPSRPPRVAFQLYRQTQRTRGRRWQEEDRYGRAVATQGDPSPTWSGRVSAATAWQAPDAFGPATARQFDTQRAVGRVLAGLDAVGRASARSVYAARARAAEEPETDVTARARRGLPSRAVLVAFLDHVANR